MRSCLLLIAIAALALPAAAAEYFVSPTGDDAAGGTREQPWQTLAKVNASLQPGDTATFLDGEYPGVIEPAASGREGAPITYRSANPQGAIIKGGKDSGGQTHCARLLDRERIVLDGFAFHPRGGGWMRLTRANHCIVRNIAMDRSSGYSSPILCEDSHHNRYQNLRVTRAVNDAGYGHVAGDMWNNFGCSHNVFEDLYLSRAGHRPFGLWFDSPNNVVRRCTFDAQWGRNFEFFSTPRLLVEQCVITNGFDGSGSADGRAKLFVIDSIFRRNLILRNHYGPLVINAYQYNDYEPFSLLRSRLYHNTFFRNHEYGFQMVDIAADPDPHRVAGNVLQNNLFAFNDPGGDGLGLNLHANIGADNRFVHNLLWGNAPGDKTVRYDATGPQPTTWPGLVLTAEEANAQWPEQFVGNVAAEPQFVDADADDLRPAPGSPAIDAGAPLAIAPESGRGRSLRVDDARWFYDGFGIEGEQGDLLMIGPEKVEARVVEADIETNTLTLDREVVWQAGDAVTLPYAGAAPDIGAYEQGGDALVGYAPPLRPEGLRLTTMETATEPLIDVGFEPENRERWFYLWNFSRMRATKPAWDDTTAASGRYSMRLDATGENAILSADLRPRWWDIDRFPYLTLSYRIPPGAPVGLWLHAFRSRDHGLGAVCVGGTATRAVGGFPALDRYPLTDDDAWHTVTIDARAIREVFPNVKLLQLFRFYTMGNATEGQRFWFDDVRIEPAR